MERNIQLIINGNIIDSKDISNISINLLLKDIQDFNKNKTSFTKPISILQNKANDVIFKSAFDINASWDKDMSPYMFNPNLKIPGELRQDGFVLISGNIQLTEITNTTYEIVLSNADFDLFQTLGEELIRGNDDKTKDLSFDAELMQHTPTQDFVRTKINEVIDPTTDDNFVYPFIDYENLKEDDIKYFCSANLLPAIQIKPLFDKIISDAGYTYEMSTGLTEVIRELYLPYNGSINELCVPETYAQRIYLGSRSLLGQKQVNENGFIEGYYFKTNTDKNLLYALPENSSSENYFEKNISATLNATIKPVVNLYLRSEISSSKTTEVTVYFVTEDRNGNINETELGVINITNEFANYSLNIDDGTTGFTYTYCDIKKFDTIGIKLEAKNDNVYYGSNDIEPNDSSLDIYVQNWLYSGEKVLNINDLLPYNYKKVDLLNDVFKMFNCYVEVDKLNSKNLLIKTYSEYFGAGKVLDWSNKVDDTNVSILQNNAYMDKVYNFKFAEGKDAYNQDFITQFGDGFGNYKSVSENEFVTTENTKQLVCAGTVFKNYTNRFYNFEFPIITNNQGFNSNWEPRILFYHQNDYNNIIWIWGTDQFYKEFPEELNNFPTLSDKRYAKYTEYNNDENIVLNFNAAKTYTSVYEDIQGVIHPNVSNRTLYNLYHKEDIERLLDVNTKLLKIKAVLTTNDISNLSLADKVFISSEKFGDAYYRINSIKNFSGDNKLCDLELIKLNYYRNEFDNYLIPEIINYSGPTPSEASTGSSTGSSTGTITPKAESKTVIYNVSGDIIPIGSVVRPVDYNYGCLNVVLAQANDDDNIKGTLLVTTATIPVDEFGYGISFGKFLYGDTSEIPGTGDLLYLSSTVPGQITRIQPDDTRYIVKIGYILNSGDIFVDINTTNTVDNLIAIADLYTGCTDTHIPFYNSASKHLKDSPFTVVNGKVGLNKPTPIYDLDISGITKTDSLIISNISENTGLTKVVVVDDNGNTYYKVNASSSGTSGTSGSSGTSGNSGTSGTSGINGVNGTSGTSGLSGSSGTSGTSGNSGTSGTSGINGTSGTSGTSGNSGTSGSSGTSGINGVNGSSGSSGTSGNSGTSGTSGINGVNGSSGSSGTSGTSGTSGINGVNGSSGTSGTSGNSGTSGTSGINGVNGTSGSSGNSGTSGTSGTNGGNGTSGSSGTSGTSGILPVIGNTTEIIYRDDTAQYKYNTSTGLTYDYTNKILILNGLKITGGTTANNSIFTSDAQGLGSWKTLAELGIQPALNGTGFVKINGTTISYDNSTYALASSLDSYVPYTGATKDVDLGVHNLLGYFKGSGVINYIPIYTGANTFGNSPLMFESNYWIKSFSPIKIQLVAPGFLLKDTYSSINGFFYVYDSVFGIQKRNYDTDEYISNPYTFSLNAPHNTLYINSAGKVGINTNTPTARLSVFESTPLGSTAGNYQIISSQAGYVNNNFQNNQYLIRKSDGSDWVSARWHDGISVDTSFLVPGITTRTWWERDPAYGIQSWGDQGVTYMTLYGSCLGIGTTNPIDKLCGIGGPVSSRCADSNGISYVMAQSSGYYSTPNYSATYISYYDINNTGNYITGVPKANLGLLVFQNVTNSLIITNGDVPLIFATHSVERMRILSNGNVGIGIIAPAYKLDVTGAVNSTLGFYENGVKITSGSGGMVYPPAGIAVSTGSAWTTSIVNNSTNWNTAYTYRLTSASGSGPLTLSLSNNTLTGSVTTGSISSGGTNLVTSGTIYSYLTSNYDKYSNWNLYVDGTNYKSVTSNTFVNFAAGSNITLSYANSTITINAAAGGGSMIYPGAGIAVSTGSAWGTSITNNSANWNTAYTYRLTSAIGSGPLTLSLSNNALTGSIATGNVVSGGTNLVTGGTVYSYLASNYDKYTSWKLYVGGTLRADIASGNAVNFAAGSNVTLAYNSTLNTITINSASGSAVGTSANTEILYNNNGVVDGVSYAKMGSYGLLLHRTTAGTYEPEGYISALTYYAKSTSLSAGSASWIHSAGAIHQNSSDSTQVVHTFGIPNYSMMVGTITMTMQNNYYNQYCVALYSFKAYNNGSTITFETTLISRTGSFTLASFGMTLSYNGDMISVTPTNFAYNTSQTVQIGCNVSASLMSI